MAKFTIKMTYLTSITKTVEADDYGEAYEKVRTAAEESDMNEFSIVEELNSEIISIKD